MDRCYSLHAMLFWAKRGSPAFPLMQTICGLSEPWKGFDKVFKKDYLCVIQKENRDDWRHAEIIVATVNRASRHRIYTPLRSSPHHRKL